MRVPAINKVTLSRPEFDRAVSEKFPLAAVQNFPYSSYVKDLDGGVLGGLVWTQSSVRSRHYQNIFVGYLHT
jgi:hypothetical protein